MDKKHIAFIWYGMTGRYGQWKDGLWKAMQILESKYTVTYHEPNEEIPEDAIVLFWEAPCTAISPQNSWWYNRVANLPNTKALLFAGGPLKYDWINKFDHVFVESKINHDELTDMRFPSFSTAFGINETIFHPMDVGKLWWGIHPGTCASWKRQGFVGEALGDKGLVVGREQPNRIDTFGFDRCRELGCSVLDEQKPEDLAVLVNQSHVCVQTSALWGGGQRVTLEALACNVPVVCMSDSPKNREYVEESGCGLVVDPDPVKIRKAVEDMMVTDFGTKGRDYVMSKWTSQHYADNLSAWIDKQK